MKIRKSIIMLVAAAMAATFTGCSDDDFQQDYNPIIDNPQTEEPTPEEPGEEVTSSRNEKYRPQIHYTPAQNWINDPNGMIFIDGTYHLYYQYNPQGNGWGNLSWGHATSNSTLR